MSLASQINKIRKKKNIQLDELSARSGVPKGTLSKISAGITENPTLETVRAIAYAMGCTLNDLDDDENAPIKKSPDTEETVSGDEREIIDRVKKLEPAQRSFLLAWLKTAGEGEKETPAVSPGTNGGTEQSPDPQSQT